MLPVARMKYGVRLCAGVFFKLAVHAWLVSVRAEGCRGLNWIHHATCEHEP